MCVRSPPHPSSLSTVHLSPGVPKPLSECIVDVESMDIFPVGWCETNGYPLTPPLKPVCMYTHKYSSTHTFPPGSDGLKQSLFNCRLHRPEAEEDSGGPAKATVRLKIISDLSKAATGGDVGWRCMLIYFGVEAAHIIFQ